MVQLAQVLCLQLFDLCAVSLALLLLLQAHGDLGSNLLEGNNGSFLLVFDLDQVIAKLCLDGTDQCADLGIKSSILKLGNHLTAGESAQITAALLGGAGGNALCSILKGLAALDGLQNFDALSLFLDQDVLGRNGLALLEEKVGKLDYFQTFACSSAAGGLRMVTSGLVPELTSEAAKMASLGAGAKVIGLYSFQLTEDDLDEIRGIAPDIFLLVGGTDGGNTENIIHNAKMLSTLEPKFPVVIAGNRSASRECQRILEKFETYVCPNVMPKFGTLNIEPTQKQIRDIFLN